MFGDEMIYVVILGVVLFFGGGILTYKYLQGATPKTMWLPICAFVMQYGGAGLVVWGLTILNNTS